MALAFVSMGLGVGSLSLLSENFAFILFFKVLIQYYYGYSAILTFTLQFLLFRENSQFAISRLCMLPLFCYRSTFCIPSFTTSFGAWKRLVNKPQLYFYFSVCLLSSPLNHTLEWLICNLQIIQPVQSPFFKRVWAREIVGAAASSWLINAWSPPVPAFTYTSCSFVHWVIMCMACVQHGPDAHAQ